MVDDTRCICMICSPVLCMYVWCVYVCLCCECIFMLPIGQWQGLLVYPKINIVSYVGPFTLGVRLSACVRHACVCMLYVCKNARAPHKYYVHPNHAFSSSSLIFTFSKYALQLSWNPWWSWCVVRLLRQALVCNFFIHAAADAAAAAVAHALHPLLLHSVEPSNTHKRTPASQPGREHTLYAHNSWMRMKQRKRNREDREARENKNKSRW